jgi:glutamyl endopeptidase
VSEQEQYGSSKHESVSNAPEESGEELLAEDEVSQDPFEGEGSEATAEDQMGTEALFELYRDPALTHTAPNTAGLRNIAEASYGTLQPGVNPSASPVAQESPSWTEAVIQTDDRLQVTTNTSTYPWRVHASLRITARDGSVWIGTGWFIGPHTLVTAGHCVFIKSPANPSRHGWVQGIQVMPGRNGLTLPYGSVTSTEFHAVTGWTEDGDQNYDYAAITIPTELGNTVGYFGFGVYPDSDLEASTVCISGYPGDKPSGTQWFHCRPVARVDSFKVYYDADTAGGQSGSAVYRTIDGDYYGVAIHAYGGATSNNGTRIVQPVYDNLVDWKG